MRIPYKGLAALGALTAGAAAINKTISNGAGELESVIGGHERIYRWRLGDIFYTVAGEGEPILFIHGLGAGCSSYEWRNNFMSLSEKFTVYALDLIGFGLSDRPAMRYDADLMTELIVEFVLDVIGRPTNVAASSHGAAYAIIAAAKHRPIIRRLILSCPTGIGIVDEPQPLVHGLGVALSLPVYGQSTYYALSSRNSIERYLKSRIYADPEAVTPDVIDQYYVSAHQPGARFSIKAFVSGDLNVGVCHEFAHLAQPVALIWGKEAKITPPANAQAFKSVNEESRVDIFDGAAQLPHEERSDLYNELALDVFVRPPEGITEPPHPHIIR